MKIVVMGPSGVGKTTIGALLAEQLAGSLVEADDFHSAESRAKMSEGIPLNDDDRLPWLRCVGEQIAATDRAVAACSALKRSYRDVLRRQAPDIVFIELTAPRALIGERARTRTGHFASPAIVDSQLSTLEPLEPDERGVRVPAIGSAPDIAGRALNAIKSLEQGGKSPSGDHGDQPRRAAPGT